MSMYTRFVFVFNRCALAESSRNILVFFLRCFSLENVPNFALRGELFGLKSHLNLGETFLACTKRTIAGKVSSFLFPVWRFDSAQGVNT